MSYYQKEKNKIRQEAIEWQISFESNIYSMEELLYWYDYFYKKAVRYGLIKEFTENGII